MEALPENIPSVPKNIIEMDLREFTGHVDGLADESSANQPVTDAYISYPAKSEEFPGAMIREYRHGKRVLVIIEQETGKELFIRNL
jgi:hypothetical protein